MPLQNRVTPLSDLIATPARGEVYGNRGCLHDAEQRIVRRHQVKRWISCRLAFKGWHRSPLMQPGRFTELFFLDEATAFAAGRRPCALCRRDDYNRFMEIVGERRADDIDERLHRERARHWRSSYRGLPDGAFVLRGGEPWLVHGDTLHKWSPAGYTETAARPNDEATVITSPSLVGVLRTGWEGVVPLFHPTLEA